VSEGILEGLCVQEEDGLMKIPEREKKNHKRKRKRIGGCFIFSIHSPDKMTAVDDSTAGGTGT
jgi:hypothetical protein